MSNAADALDLLSDRQQSDVAVESAVETQDRIRAKTSEWSGAAEIRKWRDDRRSF